MPLTFGRERVLEVYAQAAARGWVLPAFNSENLTTTEAILAAAKAHADRMGCRNLPVIVGITNTYWHRRQTVNYTHTRDWRVGLRLFLADLKVLTETGSPYAGLNVLVHLDHIQWDSDAELLGWDLRQFSSIMYDASTLPMEENIRHTRQFVDLWASHLVVEGASDEIQEAGETAGGKVTEPSLAERYRRETGVDLLVANLGTEHRAGAATSQYRGDVAQEISRRVGPCLCLHGASSVPAQQVGRLFADGVRRVNLWTALERDSSPALLEEMARHAAKIAGPQRTRQWLAEGLLGPRVDQASAATVSHYTTCYRQELVFHRMKAIVKSYLELWCG